MTNFHAQLCLARQNLQLLVIWDLFSMTNFMLSWVEHEKSFITSGPEHLFSVRSTDQIPLHPIQSRSSHVYGDPLINNDINLMDSMTRSIRSGTAVYDGHVRYLLFIRVIWSVSYSILILLEIKLGMALIVKWISSLQRNDIHLFDFNFLKR